MDSFNEIVMFLAFHIQVTDDDDRVLGVGKRRIWHSALTSLTSVIFCKIELLIALCVLTDNFARKLYNIRCPISCSEKERAVRVAISNLPHDMDEGELKEFCKLLAGFAYKSLLHSPILFGRSLFPCLERTLLLHMARLDKRMLQLLNVEWAPFAKVLALRLHDGAPKQPKRGWARTSELPLDLLVGKVASLRSNMAVAVKLNMRSPNWTTGGSVSINTTWSILGQFVLGPLRRKHWTQHSIFASFGRGSLLDWPRALDFHIWTSEVIFNIFQCCFATHCLSLVDCLSRSELLCYFNVILLYHRRHGLVGPGWNSFGRARLDSILETAGRAIYSRMAYFKMDGRWDNMFQLVR